MTEEAKTEEKKPDIIVYVITLVKDAARDYFKHFVVVGFIALVWWVWHGIGMFTSLPDKYQRLIDETHAHLKADSLVDVDRKKTITDLQKQVQDLQMLTKIRFYRDSTFLADDFKYFVAHNWVKLNNH